MRLLELGGCVHSAPPGRRCLACVKFRFVSSPLQSRIGLLPGVTAVGQISALPTVDWHLRSNFDADWKPRTSHGDAVNVEDRAVTGEYLRAMAIPLLAGRSLTEADAQAKQPRALVNQQFARQYFPNGNVIGRHLINKMTQFEIVGVIGNVRGTAGSIAAPAGPELYFLPDDEDGRRSFVVRSSVPPETLVKAIREQVQQLDPTQAIRNVATLTQRLDESVAQPRFNVGLLTSFGRCHVAAQKMSYRAGGVLSARAPRGNAIGNRCQAAMTCCHVSNRFCLSAW